MALVETKYIQGGKAELHAWEESGRELACIQFQGIGMSFALPQKVSTGTRENVRDTFARLTEDTSIDSLWDQALDESRSRPAVD